MLFLRPTTPASHTEAGWRIHVQWLARDAAGAVMAQGEADADALATLAQESWAGEVNDIVLLVPVEHTTWLSPAVPGRSVSQIRRALPFAAEEFLAQDIETMHLAHAPIRAGRPVRCAVMDDALLSQWLACLANAGLAPNHAVPDAGLLPMGPAEVSVMFDGAEALVRTPEHMARVDAQLLGDVLPVAFDAIGSAGGEPTLTLIGTAADADVGADLPRDRVRRVALPEAGALAYLTARFAPAAVPLNLLQGHYRPVRRRTAGQPARWRGIAALAALWAAVFVGGALAEGVWAERRAAALGAEAVMLYQRVYPDERPAADVHREMRRRIGQVDDSPPQFQVLLGRLAAGIGRDARGAELKSLSFNETRAELATELQLAGYAELDRLTARLTEEGLAVDIGSAEEREGRVHARLRLELAG